MYKYSIPFELDSPYSLAIQQNLKHRISHKEIIKMDRPVEKHDGLVFECITKKYIIQEIDLKQLEFITEGTKEVDTINNITFETYGKRKIKNYIPTDESIDMISEIIWELYFKEITDLYSDFYPRVFIQFGYAMMMEEAQKLIEDEKYEPQKYMMFFRSRYGVIQDTIERNNEFDKTKILHYKNLKKEGILWI